MVSHGGVEDSGSEDEDNYTFQPKFREQLDALKQACVLDVGKFSSSISPAEVHSGTACRVGGNGSQEGDEEEEEDDEELYRSIQKKLSSSLPKDVPSRSRLLASSDDEDEDDDELLFSVQGFLKMRSPGRAFEDSRADHINLETCSLEGKPVGEIQGNGGARSIGSIGTGDRTTNELGVADGACLPTGNSSDANVDSVRSGHLEPLENIPFGDHCESLIDLPVEVLVETLTEFHLVELPPAEAAAAPAEAKNLVSLDKEDINDALVKNRGLQVVLKKVMNQIEMKQKQNVTLLARAQALVDFEKQCKRRFAGLFTDQDNLSNRLICTKATLSSRANGVSEKSSGDHCNVGPPDNPDVEIFKKIVKKVSVTFVSKRWSREEGEELAKGVRQQVYQSNVNHAMEALSEAKLGGGELSLDAQLSNIGQRVLTGQDIKDAILAVNWDEVSRLYVSTRNPEECRTRWLNHEDPLINKDPWKHEEDKRLICITQEFDNCGWEKISKRLGTRRTPAECLTRYQRSLNPNAMKSSWSREEDILLSEAVTNYGRDDWGTIAACLEGRTNTQCLMRWDKVLNPSKKGGRWSVEEDKRLKCAVSVHGAKKWKNIATHVPGRTDLQCRERWCNVLDPQVKLGEWTEEEDLALEASVAEHGPHRWAVIANDLKIRTDNQCCRRWKFLHPEQQSAFNRDVHLKRIALMTNFQGRKKERPGLGPQDFISKEVNFEKKTTKTCNRKSKCVSGSKDLPPVVVHNPVQNIGDTSVESREKRAVRIGKRRIARARQTGRRLVHTSLAVSNVHTSHGPMDITGVPTSRTIFSLTGERVDDTIFNKVGDAKKLDMGKKQQSEQSGGSVKTSKQTRLKVNPSVVHALSSFDPIPLMCGIQVGTAVMSDFCDEDKSGKVKRKIGYMAGADRPSAQTWEKVSRKFEQVAGAYKPSGEPRKGFGGLSCKPEVSAFVDLVLSLRNYSTYACLVAREEDWPSLKISSVLNNVADPKPASPTQQEKLMSTIGDLLPHDRHQGDITMQESSEPVLNAEVLNDGGIDKLERSQVSTQNEGLLERSSDEMDAGVGVTECDIEESLRLGARSSRSCGGDKFWSVDGIPTDTCAGGGEKLSPLNDSSSVECGALQCRPSECVVTRGHQRVLVTLRLQGSSSQTDNQADPEIVCSCRLWRLEVLEAEMNSLDSVCQNLSAEDEEVSCATRAVLSWPFFDGMQELVFHGGKFLRSRGRKKSAGKVLRKNNRDTTMVTQFSNTDTGKIVKKRTSDAQNVNHSVAKRSKVTQSSKLKGELPRKCI